MSMILVHVYVFYLYKNYYLKLTFLIVIKIIGHFSVLGKNVC